MLELARRLVCTSGLLLMADHQSALLFAIVTNLIFTIAYSELMPFWERATNTVQTLCNFIIILAALFLLLMDARRAGALEGTPLNRNLDDYANAVMFGTNGRRPRSLCLAGRTGRAQARATGGT